MADAGIEPTLFFCLFLVLRRNALHSNNELKTWRLATVVLVLLAAFVFFSQRFIGRFDPLGAVKGYKQRNRHCPAVWRGNEGIRVLSVQACFAV